MLVLSLLYSAGQISPVVLYWQGILTKSGLYESSQDDAGPERYVSWHMKGNRNTYLREKKTLEN